MSILFIMSAEMSDTMVLEQENVVQNDVDMTEENHETPMELTPEQNGSRNYPTVTVEQPEETQVDKIEDFMSPRGSLKSPGIQILLSAEEKKEEGNKHYAGKSYLSAISCYTEAIVLCPDCAAYYSNRAASYIMLSKYDKALEDARKAVQIDTTFIKGHLREAKCHLAMGEAQAAIVSYQTVLQLDPNNNIATTEIKQAQQLQNFIAQAENSYKKADFRHVLFCMDRSVSIAPACRKFKVLKAECLALLRRYQESQEMANDILRLEGGVNPDAIHVRGLCLYYQDNIDKAFKHFQQVLRLAPDHSKAKEVYKKAKQLMQKKEEGNNAFRGGRMQEAYDLYTQALDIDPNNVFTNSKLYANRATVCSKISKLSEAIDDCTKALELDDTYLKAYLRRAKCYMDTEQYEEAVRDYEKIFKMDKSREHKQLLQEAKLELKKSKRKDFYKILGVTKNATEDEIKKAYRKRALLHHPDRHSNATDEVRKGEEKKFKEIGEAYAVLSDSKKKSRYDSGQDLDDLGGGGGFQDIDPNMIFQTFFGGAGGHPGGFSFNHGGGGGGGGGFPGGFQFQFG